MTPHPHAEIIKAWADGHTIQCRTKGKGEWFDVQPHSTPAFFEHAEYRVKPQHGGFRTYETHMYWNDPSGLPICTDAYPPNVRFTFEGVRLIDVEMAGDW